MRSIGVIGCGVVGSAVARGFAERGFHVVTYDKYKEEHQDATGLFNSDAIFLCLPTPTLDDGTQDLTSLRESLKMIVDNKYRGVVVIKSTVLPGTTATLSAEFGIHRLVHNPEFLTAAHAFRDFMEQPAILIGGPVGDAVEVAEIYFDAGFSGVQLRDQAAYTEMAKYAHNIMLASRVNMANEFYERCEVMEIDYSKMIALAKSIGQIGETHLDVPGPDGKLGFGGACFPKDTLAMNQWDIEMGIDGEELDAIIIGNHRRRPEEYET